MLIWKVLLCQFYPFLLSKIILQIYLSFFLLKNFQTFFKLCIEMFTRETEKNIAEGDSEQNLFFSDEENFLNSRY